MDFGLKGKVALVAASSRGLGRAVAEELANEGVNLLLCARGEKDLDEARAEISGKSDTQVIAVAANLTEPDEVKRVVDTGLQAFQNIDILVTNTGGPPSGVFESLTPEAWQEAIRQNLESVLNLTRAVLPGMKERGWGRILNITSISVKQPVDNLILSNSVRAAVTGFARTLANEVARFGITVNNILPGYTRTSRVEALAGQIAKSQGTTAEEAIGGWEAQIPMGRIGEPREFAALVAFLASERASYITGASIPVDGGWIRALY